MQIDLAEQFKTARKYYVYVVVDLLIIGKYEIIWVISKLEDTGILNNSLVVNLRRVDARVLQVPV